MSDDRDRRWWEASWTERENALWDTFGRSHPHGAPEGYVTSFDWEKVPLPSACAYTFPPRPADTARHLESRPTWFYVTHGFAQWSTPDELAAARRAGNRHSGAGHEFAMIVDRPAPWVPGLLQSFMAYDHAQRSTSQRGFEPGDRIPFRFESLAQDDVRYALGGDARDPRPAADDTRSLLFWRYLSVHGTFTTGTGSFEIRVATTITAAELKLAQTTSSCHLLLLLEWAGIRQRSIPGRACVTQIPDWQSAWAPLSKLPFVDAKARLHQLTTRPGFP